MKFTAGYVIGAATILGLEAAFIGGAVFYGWLNQTKNDKIEELKDEDVLMALAKLIKKEK